MNIKETTKVTKNSLSFISLPLVIGSVLLGLFTPLFTNNSRQYYPGNITVKDGDALGMSQYFFNARKNITTNAMDYPSMLAADKADRAMSNKRSHHSLSTLPDFTWNSMGPTNIAGRTRAFLIDKNDATHQTVFAGGVSGGIWKSTNGGGTWGPHSSDTTISYSQNDSLSNMNVSCIAQDANGVMYMGTGEEDSLANAGQGFSTGMLGGGIFKSTDDGTTWNLLPSTAPTPSNDSVAWAYVNQIAIRPDNPAIIYAATNSGLYVSHNSGATWNNAIVCGANSILASNSLDVKISGDGSVVVACVGGFGYYCYPQNGPDSCFTEMNSTVGYGRINRGDTAASLIEFAISPTDPNRIYASYIDYTGNFGTGAKVSCIMMTQTGKTNGGYWYNIGSGGSNNFNPYGSQAVFSNALQVCPSNEGELLVGGSTLWAWLQLSPTDSAGSWAPISHSYEYYAGDPLWIELNEHTIVFDQNNPATVYVGCDGGIYESTNLQISSSNIEGSIADIVFQPDNRDLDITQYYSVCYAPQVNYYYNYTTNQEGLGIGGGAQDNGSPYINGVGYYAYSATDMSGGDGGGSVISSLDPNIAYFSTDDATFLRTSNLGTLTFPTLSYTQTKGDSLGANIDSVWSVAVLKNKFCSVFPVALYENPYDLLNHDSLQFIATINYPADTTIWLVDQNGPTSYPYVLPRAVSLGDTIMVPDRVVSRVAIGFSPTYGIWINGQGASNGTIIWMPIAYGALSTPVAFADTNAAETPQIHCLTWSPDGDALFAGTEDGVLFRFSNLNTIIANKFYTGGLWYNSGGIHDITTQVVSANLSFSQLYDRDILSIAVDPQNGNNVLVTLGNYGESAYVYYSGNALDSAGTTFQNVQGNLPYMPVYSSILDIRNADGSWSTNSAMVATEHGIYTTDDITASPVVWVKNNNGMANCLTLAIKQQTLPNWECNNSGDIYVGSYGRGVWVSSTNYQAPTAVPIVKTSAAFDGLMVYPNPMTNQGNIEFTLASAQNVTITIYDMKGTEVKTVNMGIQSPGNHIVPFNSTGFPGGIYFATLTADNVRKVSKFVVTK